MSNCKACNGSGGEDGFWRNVDMSGDCWPWRGSHGRGGYGKTKRGGKTIRTHRLAFELACGPIPPGLHVLHRCDNPPCCNPAHLWLGTNFDNMRDKKNKDRHARGERNGNAKLTAASVECLRVVAATRVFAWRDLARWWGIHLSQLVRILGGRAWRTGATP